MIYSHSLVPIRDDILNEIVFEVEGCPISAVALYVRRAFSEFCEKTHAWQEPVSITTIDSVSNYIVPQISSREVIEVLRVIDEANGVELQKSNDYAIGNCFWQESPGRIEIFSDFLAPSVLSLHVAVRPSATGADYLVSDRIQSDYASAIAAGAKSMLYKVASKEWTDLQQAQIEAAKFQSAIGEARLHVANGFSRLALPSVRKNRPFF